MINRSLISTSYMAISPWDGISKVRLQVINAGYAVVIDNDGLCGILTPQDIIKKNHKLVVDCLGPLQYITTNDSLRTALDLMDSNKIDALPCCDNGKFFGVVTRNAITEYMLQCTEELAEALDTVNHSNKKIKESEKKFRQVVNILGEGIAIVNAEDEFVFANPAAHNIFNLTNQRLEGKKICNILSEHEYLKFQQSVSVAKKEGKCTHDAKVKTRKGVVKHLLVTTTPNFNDFGNFIGTYCVFRDITDKEKNLNSLKEKTISLNERVKELNCLYNASKLFGNQNKSLDKIFHDLVKLIPKGYRYSTITYVKLIIKGNEYRTSNYTDTPWKLSCNISANGKLVGNITVGYTEQKEAIHDGPFHISEKNMLSAITKHLGGVIERRQNQEALRLKDFALASSINAIAISDLDGNLTYVNKSFLKLWGYNNEEEVIGMSLVNLWQNIKNVNEVKVKVLRTGKYSATGFAKRKNGTLFYADTKSSLIYDEKGAPIAALGVFVDITNRKQAEDALISSQRKLRAIIDNVPTVIFWKDINNRYLGCNQQFANYVGMSVEEVIGKTDADMPWSDYKENFIADDLEVFRTGKAKLNFEEQGNAVNGEPTWVRTSKVPLLDANNNIISVIGMFEDITEQKKINDELEIYRNHLENQVKERTYALNEAQRIAKIGSWKYDVRTKNLEWSDEVYRIFEKNPKTYVPTYSSFIECLKPDDKVAFKKKYRQSLKKKRPYTLEYQIVTQSGKTKWIFQLGENHFNKKGQPIYTVGTVQDITIRKNLELKLKEKDAEFELFFENINEVILILDAKGRTVYANSIFEKIFDISIKDQLQKPLTYLGAIHTEDIPGFTEFIINQTDNPNPLNPSTFEFRINQKNGSILWLMIKAIPVFSKNGILSRLILLFSDITHQKQMHREILNAIVTAEERERTRFAQDLHDGIGPLLSTSKLYLQWLKRPDTISKKDTLLKQAEDTIEEAIKCTREISHNLSPSLLTRFGLISALNSFINRVKESQSLSFKFSHDLKTRLNYQTETSIYRVATESINNAIKHADATEISVDIKLISEILYVTIKDNGKGFNLNEVLSKKQGLGIINMNNRIETLGGKIGINTAKGEGTQIKIAIPVTTSFGDTNS
ncbi:MAG: PAS domain S-box protein [Bacteroidales bacterium]